MQIFKRGPGVRMHVRISCLFFCQISQSTVLYIDSTVLYTDIEVCRCMARSYLLGCFVSNGTTVEHGRALTLQSASFIDHRAVRLCNLLLCARFLRQSSRNWSPYLCKIYSCWLHTLNQINNVFVRRKAKCVFAVLQILKSIWLSGNVA